MWTMTDLTINTLKKINELGHEVVISTGRAFRTSTHFYNLLDLKTPIINHNGALISNPTNDDFKRIERFVSYNDVIKIFMNNKDRKSIRLNSSHVRISYAVFCLKKK